MKFKTPAANRLRHEAGFTLAEVLAALFFMALVIPVAVETLHIASQAGSTAQRKNEAARVAQAMLNENVLSGNWSQNTQGTVRRNGHDYQWRLHNETWPLDTMQLVTAEVVFSAGDRTSLVRLSTLVNPTNATLSTVSVPLGDSPRLTALAGLRQP
jgi:type II secretory pathway pseudopilin PulG